MARDHAGKPTGANTSESSTGIPSNISPENEQENRNMTEKYTEDDKSIAENVHTRHPNRNTEKDDATNIGGYKS
ncbi:MAG: hypothetical protein ACJ75F_09150 [Flavisolibacter sp.]|jgi:hypothetical protein